MRKWIVCVATVLCCLSAAPRAAEAAGGPFGLGILLGSPTGISGKYFFAPQHAMDFCLGWGWAGSSALQIHADYLVHFSVARPRHFELKLFFGGGLAFFVWGDGRGRYWDDDRDGRAGLGIRVPIGIAFHIRKVPIDPFIEVVPGIGLFPGVGALVQGGIGIRYYF